ncbi:hypothetical protein CPLU01_09680 [Colletotrichum plurivorum]|uniref:Uncharacterized protein n=1 Tax=Colletotrichum plurivorum TaxID=2175906 RepID=A0A8H6K8E5_9PEZI|nr:hypothetical protein CPLU01_09680 [Colletotrichum plurivorum]
MDPNSTQDQLPTVFGNSMETSGGLSSPRPSPQPAQPVAPQSASRPVSDTHSHTTKDLPNIDGNQSSQSTTSDTLSGTKKHKWSEFATCYLKFTPMTSTAGQQNKPQQEGRREAVDRCRTALRLAVVELKPEDKFFSLTMATCAWLISQNNGAFEYLQGFWERQFRMACERGLQRQEPCPPEECPECQEREECQECEKHKECTECRECRECTNCEGCNHHKEWEAVESRLDEVMSTLKPQDRPAAFALFIAKQVTFHDDRALESVVEYLKRDTQNTCEDGASEFIVEYREMKALKAHGVGALKCLLECLQKLAQKAHEDGRNQGNHN